jgi:hypothetical protein
MKNVRLFRSKEADQNAVVTGSKPDIVYRLNDVKCEVSRHFRNKKREYVKAGINELWK